MCPMYVIVFNILPTAEVIQRWPHGLKYHQTDRRNWGSNLQHLVHIQGEQFINDTKAAPNAWVLIDLFKIAKTNLDYNFSFYYNMQISTVETLD